MTSRQVRYIARFVALVGMVGGAARVGAQVAGDSGSASPRIAVPASPTRLWLSGGAGFGRSGPSASNGVDQYGGMSIDLAAGARLTSRGYVALDATLWHRNLPNGSSRSSFFLVTLLGYPFNSFMNKLYFQAGVGMGHASFPTLHVTTNQSRLNITEPAVQIGVGYDIPVACPLWITPFVQSLDTFGGARRAPSANPLDFGSANAVLVHAGVAIRFFHAGPRGACTERPDITLR
ncbi:MAG TPA: hypothetical protein VJV22_06580 [Acidobacteriaceae bacterium]|nr:hypothetical protein [Acidobacteriaceae bacterium]